MSLPDYVLKGARKAATYLGKTFTASVSMTSPSFISTGLNTESIENGITASTTQTRAGGYALTKAISRVTTVANASDAVTLPALSPGQSVVVYNDDATNAAKVFPNGASDTIDGGSAGASVTLTHAKRCRYLCVAANTIVSSQLGAVSA